MVVPGGGAFLMSEVPLQVHTCDDKMASHTLHLGGAGPGTAPGGGRCSRCRRSARSRLSSEAGSAPPSTCRRVPFIVWAVNIFASSETRVQHRRPVLLWSASRGADSRFQYKMLNGSREVDRPTQIDLPSCSRRQVDVVFPSGSVRRVPVRLSFFAVWTHGTESIDLGNTVAPTVVKAQAQCSLVAPAVEDPCQGRIRFRRGSGDPGISR